MIRSISRMSAVALAVLFGVGLAACTSVQDPGSVAPSSGTTAQGSGFLKDYSRLQPETDAFGVQRRVWISPKLNRANYQKILLERVTFYPEPQPTSNVSMGTLNQIRDYGDSALRGTLANVAPLTDQPGPGVLRIRVAITAASVQGPALQPYQLIPAALVLTMAVNAAGGGTANAQLAVESEGTDSVTGESLFKVVREAKGIELPSNQSLTLPMVKPRIDEWAASAQQVLATRMKAAGN